MGSAIEANHVKSNDRTSSSRARDGSDDRNERLANALGWFSVGLGLAQIAAPDRVARLVGVKEGARARTVMRTLGLRELTSGVGILAGQDRSRWLWSRVAGDAMDIGMLGKVMASDDNDRGRTVGATLAVLGVTALDVFASEQLSKKSKQEALRAGGDIGISVKKSVTVNLPPEEVYAFWRDFENLPRFMRHLESVRTTGPRTSHWKAAAPAGMTVEWNAEIISDQPNESISWRSIEGSEVENAGTVRFVPAPGGRGTEVTVGLEYAPPGGKLAAAFAKLFHEEPGQQVEDDLRAFKQVLETGEILLSDATVTRAPHAAQPQEDR